LDLETANTKKQFYQQAMNVINDLANGKVIELKRKMVRE
jgi:hypothetical protein